MKKDRKQKLLTEIRHAFRYIYGDVLDTEIYFISAGIHFPFLLFLFMCLTLAVPFLGYHYAKMYRNKICGGTIGFAHACLFTLFMYMFASLLVAVAHYIYFQFIDHGFIMNQYVNLMQQVTTELPGMANEKEMLKNAIDSAQALSPIDITMQLLSSDVFFGSLIAIPTACL